MEEYPSDICDDEIDLQELALTLWRGKWMIVATTLLAAVATLAISLALPKQYQAETELLLSQPKITTQIKEGFSLNIQIPDLKTVTAIAQAPGLFQRLVQDPAIQSAWAQEERPLTWQTLANSAKVEEKGESGLALLFKDTTPQRAALVANHWAALVADDINKRYGWAGVNVQIAPQVEAAWKDYQTAQADYLQTVRESRATAVTAQLKEVKTNLDCVLSLAGNLERLQANVAAFEKYLGGLEPTFALSPGDALTLATLQQQVLATKVCLPDTANVEMQWSADITGLTVAEARSLVKELGNVLQQRGKGLPEQQQLLGEETTKLEQALEEENARLKEARQKRDLAWHVYQSLAALRSQDQALTSPENQVALVAAQAVPPEKPVSPRTKMNVALAGILGLMVSVMGVWGHSWWAGEPTDKGDVHAQENAS